MKTAKRIKGREVFWGTRRDGARGVGSVERDCHVVPLRRNSSQ